MPLTTDLGCFFELVHVSPELFNHRLKALNGGLEGSSWVQKRQVNGEELVWSERKWETVTAAQYL